MEIDPIVVNKARAAGRQDWLDDLPDLVDDLCGRWGLTPGEPIDGGTEAFVMTVERDGTPAVLKILMPRPGVAVEQEIDVLVAVDGDGCAAVLDHDRSVPAIVLERLGPAMFECALPYEERIPILADLAHAVWRPAEGLSLSTGAEKARWLIDAIAERSQRLGNPVHDDAVALALDCARRRLDAHDPDRAVLCHGDVHQWNALRAGDGFKLVDPDGVVAEPALDLGVLMREDPDETVRGDPWDRARFLADRTGVDLTAIWEWGVVERVSTALVCFEVDLQPVGREMADAARYVLDWV